MKKLTDAEARHLGKYGLLERLTPRSKPSALIDRIMAAVAGGVIVVAIVGYVLIGRAVGWW